MLAVNATRMELLHLRRRLGIAARGHRLLSEKRDELSRQLVQIARQIMPLRKRVETEMLEACRRFMLARATMEPEDIRAALEVPAKQLSIQVRFENIMSVKVPQLLEQFSGEVICHGFATTSGELDAALKAVERAFEDLVKLAGAEKQARLLAAELRMTRRRVNVLEHVIIPRMEQTIRFIFDKLAEAERDNISRLMKITDIIRA
jgi:V/A-type H+-transporting ATPase subunit D